MLLFVILLQFATLQSRVIFRFVSVWAAGLLWQWVWSGRINGCNQYHSRFLLHPRSSQHTSVVSNHVLLLPSPTLVHGSTRKVAQENNTWGLEGKGCWTWIGRGCKWARLGLTDSVSVQVWPWEKKNNLLTKIKSFLWLLASIHFGNSTHHPQCSMCVDTLYFNSREKGEQKTIWMYWRRYKSFSYNYSHTMLLSLSRKDVFAV